MAAGISQYSAQVGVTVVTNPGSTNAQAWSMSGPGFVGFGAGLRFTLQERFALQAGPRLNIAFGPGGVLPSISPEVALQYGF